MSAISTLLTRLQNTLSTLRAAIWAIDVRDDIADAIEECGQMVEQCYSDVSNPTLRTEALEAALQNKIDQGKMAALTIGDGTITAAKLALGVIDNTLATSGAAADAKATGDALSALEDQFAEETDQLINYLVSLPYITGYAVSLSQEPVDLNLSSSSNFKRCTIVNCIEGDVFIINATGLTGARAWAILDSSNMIISMADANAVVENLRLVMPAGASKLVVNSTSDAISYKYGKNYLSLSPQNLLDNEKKQLYENIGLKDSLKDLNEDILFKILDCLRNVSWSNNGGEYFVSRLEKECVPEFYHSTIWAYPSQNGKLINGSEIRADVPNTFEPNLTWPVLAIDTSDRYSKLAVVNRGVRPYIDNNTLDDTQVYPIPVPDGINKITISVSPADIQIHPSLWHYLTTALRYSRKDDEDYGVIGTGYVELNNITRLPDDRMYLCVRFTKEDRSPFEIDNYKINYYIS